MKKKVWKILALIAAIALVLVVCVFANALNGNPISKMLARNAAENYLTGHYPGTDYYVERVGFSFKDTCYYAHIRSGSSVDTQFALYIDMVGNVSWDTYEDVLSGSITARRLEQEYRELTDQLLTGPTFPFQTDIAYGTLEIYPKRAMDDPLVTDIPSYAMAQEDLMLDHMYDPRDMGSNVGHLVIYIESNTITTDYAAEVLLIIRETFDNANIPFKAIDFTLHFPLPEEGSRPKGQINVDNFSYEDIYADGLAERIQAADEARDAYYAEQDAKGGK